MSLWHRVKVVLGLADEYEDEFEDDYYDEDEGDGGRPYASPYGSDVTSVRRVTREPDIQRARQVARRRSDEWGDEDEPVQPSSRSQAHLRSVPRDAVQVKMHICEPRSFTEAQAIADRFKTGTPVIMNLLSTDPDLAKRLIDFASGLTYGLGGGLQKVSEKVFMLTPANVDVSAEDRRRLRDKGLFTID